MQIMITHESDELPDSWDGRSWDKHRGLDDVLVASELCFHRPGFCIHKTGGLTAKGNLRNLAGQPYDRRSYMVV